MAYGGSNDDVIDDVTWPSKIKVMIPISFRSVISKTARVRDSVLTGHHFPPQPYIQESLANAKVNARQHCVSLSCLCVKLLSLTQIEWVADFSLGDEDSENIASERYENRHPRRPLSCLTPHISRTSVNICIILISLETTFSGLHFCCWQYGSTAFI